MKVSIFITFMLILRIKGQAFESNFAYEDYELYLYGTYPYSTFGTRGLRQFSTFVYDHVNTNHGNEYFRRLIQNYGCHCFPDSKRYKKQLVPSSFYVDPLDKLCLDLAKCRSCLKLRYPDLDPVS